MAASSSSSSSSVRTCRCLLLLLLLSLISIASSSPPPPPPPPPLNQHKRTLQSSNLSRAQARLSRLNKHPISSIQSADGDIIDCVSISHQPALEHPKLEKHHHINLQPPPLPPNLRKRPTSIPSRKRSAPDAPVNTHFMPVQLWHHQGEKCPDGTIPVRRTQEEDVLRAAKVPHYGRKRRHHHPARVPVSLPMSVEIRDSQQANATTHMHQHAIVYVQGDNYYGARATINVWDPLIDAPNEFSLSQVWILGGSFDSDLNSIEAGWQVTPELYGDNNTRLFTYWTYHGGGEWDAYNIYSLCSLIQSDAYQGTGCYNLLCSGFVQISGQIALGATISPLSVYGDKQYDIDILIWKDPNGGDWWMSLGENHIVGYWPSSLFTYLAESATMVQWGGEVVNKEPDGRHTTTQMGSGRFAYEEFGRAAYFSNLQVVDANNILRAPNDINTFAENSACYDVQNGYNENWGYYFYFGGPGLSDRCP